MKKLIPENKWFTIDKIDNNTYIISEYHHWEQMHSYLIIGKDKAILLDTGLGLSNIKTCIDQITKLPIEVITTHAHWDHIGGHNLFKKIHIHRKEKEWLTGNFPLPLEVVKKQILANQNKIPEKFNINDYKIPVIKEINLLDHEQIIELGNRTLKVIHTPGHSPGHICLYDIQNKYLFTGDLIYSGTLYAFYPTTNPEQYMKSVQTLKNFKINNIFPAHNSLKINTNIISEIEKAFTELYNKGNLIQGKGIFKYKNFNIHI